MGNWMIANGCTVDENSREHAVVKNGKPVHLRPQCWDLLIALLEAKKHERILAYAVIGEVLWGNDGGWDDARKESLKKVLDEIRDVLGKDAIVNTYGTGYYLTYDVKEVFTQSVDTRAYYAQLWANHYKGFVRDRVGTGNVRELVDFFVLPTITAANGQAIDTPFAGAQYKKFVTAGSGFGKSTLLDMVLLCNIFDDLQAYADECISENSAQKAATYQTIRASLFGDAGKRMFPVFIHANEANTAPYTSALALAEGATLENFELLVDEAYKAGNLLFLVDSIDEVEADKMSAFLSALHALIKKYPNAAAVFASRFLGKRGLPFPCEALHLSALEKDNIHAIVYAMLSKKAADTLLAQMQENSYVYALAKNPFMLTTMLEIKGDRQLHLLLESIVNAIIDRRWEKYAYNMSSEDIKLLLGFLASKFVFDGWQQAELSEIRQAFFKAENILHLYGVSYDVPKQNIEYFLKTLSSQSGILNVVNKDHVEQYVFQDTAVMCWLAANYINRIINESDEILEWKGTGGIWSNAHWIDRCIRTISQKEITLSEEAVDVLVLSLVMSSGTNSPDIQKSLLYYLLFKDATSWDAQEKQAIRKGYTNIKKNVFGFNDITNSKNSECLQLINNMLNA